MHVNYLLAASMVSNSSNQLLTSLLFSRTIFIYQTTYSKNRKMHAMLRKTKISLIICRFIRSFCTDILVKKRLLWFAASVCLFWSVAVYCQYVSNYISLVSIVEERLKLHTYRNHEAQWKFIDNMNMWWNRITNKMYGHLQTMVWLNILWWFVNFLLYNNSHLTNTMVNPIQNIECIHFQIKLDWLPY